MRNISRIQLLKITTASLLISGLMAVPFAVLPTTVEAVVPGYNGTIVFTSDREGDKEIYSIAVDGSNPINLTHHPSNDGGAEFSPDGSKIVFHSDRDGDTEIFVMNADGSGLQQLTTNTYTDNQATWAPDGTRIAFVSNRDGNNEIYVMSADGSNQSRLTNNTVNEYTPSWSPTGSRIAFRSSLDGNPEIYTMNSDGGEIVRLTNDPATDTGPVWSPDGSKILFNTDRDGDGELYVMDADGENAVRLTEDDGNDTEAYWSPDGGKIAWKSDRDGNNEIYIMNADGSNKFRVTNNPSNDAAPKWQPIPNTTPTTTPDTLTTHYNTTGLIDVLANDSDEEALGGQYLTIATQPLNGTASVVDGKVKYIPNDGFYGSDQLTYQICDSFLLDQQCATGVLSITVQVPGAPAVNVTKVGEVSYVNGTTTYSTSTKRPTFSGTASPGAIIKVEIHSDPILLTTTAGSDGAWSVTPSADLPTGDHTVYITATLNGVTTELDSFVLAITDVTELPSTGASTLPLRVGGFGLLAVGAALHFIARRRARYTVPSLFP